MEDQQPETEAGAKPEKPSFWTTVPGVLTGLAALVTAGATLLAAANQAGFFGADDPSEESGGAVVETHGDNSPVVQDTGGDVTITSGGGQ